MKKYVISHWNHNNIMSFWHSYSFRATEIDIQIKKSGVIEVAAWNQCKNFINSERRNGMYVGFTSKLMFSYSFSTFCGSQTYYYLNRLNSAPWCIAVTLHDRCRYCFSNQMHVSNTFVKIYRKYMALYGGGGGVIPQTIVSSINLRTENHFQ